MFKLYLFISADYSIFSEETSGLCAYFIAEIDLQNVEWRWSECNFLTEMLIKLVRNFRLPRNLHFIVIIKRGRQCKAGREWFTPCQSNDHRRTILTYRQKEEKLKNSEDRKGSSSFVQWRSSWPSYCGRHNCKTRQSHTIEYLASRIIPQGRYEEIKVLRYCEVL